MGTTINPNQTLLQSRNQSPSDQTPAPLAGSSSAVAFAFKDIAPPSPLYVDVDDNLGITAASSVGNETVTVNLRLLEPNGRLQDMQFQLPTAANRTVARQTFRLMQGFILSASAVSASAVTRGQTFVRVFIQRGASGAASPAQILFADYVTNVGNPAFPNGRVVSPVEGPGMVYTFNVASPAAGSDWTQLPPLGARWRVRSGSALLTTSAVVANRVPSIFLQSPVQFDWIASALANIVASTAARVSFSGISPYIGLTANQLVLPLPPDLVIGNNGPASANIGTSTANLQAADQWSQIQLLVEEWLDNV